MGDHMDCSNFMDHVFEYLDGELTDEEATEFARHVRECPPCLDEYHRDQALKALIRRGCACEAAPVQLRTQIIASFTSITIEYGR
ncbi:mycothiol system anti-sigma-R factor [Arsenicicoccus sp. oral taxon 190]|uniref:mycothiol system anti-sigma-R factor n=1 Tax=Arsenicicoccus sp. oral taxon 190 TaxID=1658671 RepID=UPI00067A0DAA|nr:mycothiol system anti-sigma-R factor [Arsenicicoccus sp. oral taxon 190]AKT51414.1 hypothetical protein ADJ73_08960 [Arsenicicoccus sp. oral taxon 190]